MQASVVHSSITGTAMHFICNLQHAYRSIESEHRTIVQFYRRLESLLLTWFSSKNNKVHVMALNQRGDPKYTSYIALSLRSLSQPIHYILLIIQKHWRSSLSCKELGKDATVDIVGNCNFPIKSMKFCNYNADWMYRLSCTVKIQGIVLHTYVIYGMWTYLVTNLIAARFIKNIINHIFISLLNYLSLQKDVKYNRWK